MKQHHGCPLLGQAPTSPCQRNIDSQEEAGPQDALCNLGGYVQWLLQDVVPVDEESWDDIHRDIPLVAESAALSYSSLAGAASCQKSLHTFRWIRAAYTDIALLKLAGSWAIACWLHDIPGCANSQGREIGAPASFLIPESAIRGLGDVLWRPAHSCSRIRYVNR